MKYLFLTLFGALGVMMLIVGVKQSFQQRRLLTNVRQVAAHITRSDVVKQQSSNTDQRPLRDNSTTSFRAEIEFEYEIQGVRYSSAMLYPTVITTSYPTEEMARQIILPYPVDSEVQAYVNPDFPDRAFLVKESSIGPVVFVIVGIAAILFGCLLARLS